MSLCDWTMHIYGNGITKTHCHTTMEFLLAWSLQPPLNSCAADVVTQSCATALCQHCLDFHTLEDIFT